MWEVSWFGPRFQTHLDPGQRGEDGRWLVGQEHIPRLLEAAIQGSPNVSVTVVDAEGAHITFDVTGKRLAIQPSLF